MKALCLLILVVCWSMDGSEAYPGDNDDNDALMGLARMAAADISNEGGQSSNEHDENEDKDEDIFIQCEVFYPFLTQNIIKGTLLELFGRVYQAGGLATLSTTTMGGKMKLSYEVGVDQVDDLESSRSFKKLKGIIKNNKNLF